jgi:NAD(P)-dependent dehydrogenase (short-subunit alcohol dehydrogenase family)
VTAGALTVSPELDELAGTGEVQPVEVDLAEPSGPVSLVAAAGDRIDILVNNMGAAPSRPGGFGETTDEDWQTSLTLNLMAAVRTTRAALPVMLAANKGAIVSISSVNAVLPGDRRPAGGHREPGGSADRDRPVQPPGRSRRPRAHPGQ